ncbi:Spindle-related protein [Penicillium sp. IBT 16267x]|nr:Spindle-related protein [Penicillium sp. IBT 16267x]
MEPGENTRPVSQLIAGFASPSTPAGPSGSRRSLFGQSALGQSYMGQSIRSVHPPPPPPPAHDVEKDELRVQVSTLRYELENIKQERDLQTLRFEKETRDLQLKADADFKRAQAAETASNRATHKIEALAKELKDTQEQALNEKASLERKARNLQDENQMIQEELAETQAQASDHERQSKYQISELETVRVSLQKTIEELQKDLLEARAAQQATQEKLNQREAEVADLESDNIRLKAEGSDGEALVVLKRELTEQVTHLRELETTNRDQMVELQHLRKVQKNVQVVEEQKRSLENQLQLMEGVEAEFETLQIQKQVLEDERQSWASLLDENDQPAEFDSPEAIVKALVQERIEKATFIDRLGAVDAQFLEKEEAIKALEDEMMKLKQELETARATASTSVGAPAAADARARARLERQRVLAVKEVEYLRAQLKTFDEEETTMNAEQSQFDEQKAAQIAQLQQLVDEYRIELHKVHEELSLRKAPPQEEPQPRGTKRPLSPADSAAENQRLAVLTRKNRKLQEALSKSEQATTLAKKELDAANSQLRSLKAKSRTRVLELRDNPTAEAENIKMTTLKTLQSENRDLLAQLRGDHAGVKVAPVSTVEALKLEIQEMERVVADKEKRNRRLREIYSAKATEFREAVASLLGYKLDILPNGRVRVTSMFHLSPEYRHGDASASSESRGPGSMGNGEENSILFDGENGSMKLSGGNNSLFAMEIKPLLKFWVQERKDIPCFLAAMTLDFYDKTTRATRV